jgi:MoaA/NifB/PqqE/SkfB family radical SAM enzyme
MKTNNFLKAPLTINWAVTNRCNFSCQHCYSRTDPSEELDCKTLFICIEKIVGAGVLSINFGGGNRSAKDLNDIAAFASGKGCGSP